MMCPVAGFRWLWCLSVLAILSLGLTASAGATPLAPQQSGGIVELADQFGGTVSVIATNSRRAFVGVGPRVAVLNLDDPDKPSLVGWTEVLPAPVLDLAIAADRLIAATGDSGLLIFDIAGAPNTPRTVDHLDVPRGAFQIVASDTHAYTLTGSDLWVIRVAGPGPAEVVRSVSLFPGETPGERAQLVLSDDYLFIGYQKYGIGAVDVRIPEATNFVAWKEDVPSWTLAVGDGFVATSGMIEQPDGSFDDTGIQILSLDSAQFLSVVGRIEAGESSLYHVGTLAASGHWLFAQRGRELQAVSVVDPASPVIRHRFELPPRGPNATAGVGFYRPRQMHPSGSNLYLVHNGGFDADHTGSGVIALNLNDEGGFRDVGSWLADLPGDVQRIESGGGDYLVLSEFLTGILRLYRQLPDGTLEALGVLPVDIAGNFAIDGSTLYLADPGLRELRAVDLTDPRHPVTIARETIEGLSDVLAVHKGRAYVMRRVSSEVGGTAYDLDVYLPAADGHLTLTGVLPATCRNAVQDMVIDGTRLYLACRRDGLIVVDIADADRPALVAQVPIDAEARAVFIRGSLAFVATRWPTPPDERELTPLPTYGGLRIVDLDGRAEIGAFRTTIARGNAKWDVAVVGRYAVLTVSGEALHIIDVGDPTRPSLGQVLHMPTIVGEITARGDRVYVTGSGGGVYIFRWLVDPDERIPVTVFLPFALQSRRNR